MNDTFDDIWCELSADLAAAVEAQVEHVLHPRTTVKKSETKNISDSGAPILTGKGLEAVRKIMEQRFAVAMQTGPTSLVPPEDVAKTAEHSALTRAAAPKPPRFEEHTAILVRAAERSVGKYKVQMPHHENVYWVSVQENVDLNALFADAIAVIERDMPKVEKRSDRHDILDEKSLTGREL